MKNGRQLFRRIPRFGRLNLGCAIIVMVICTALVPAAASSPVVAQEQTSWYVNDDPSLFGPSEYWYWGDPGHGYGSNYYRYTYAIGGARSADNWARWSMGPRVGLQEIQVYVPSNHATATVYYNITIGSRTFRRSVAQASVSGWHSLGNWDAGGADVVVAVYDNDAGHHKDRHGFAASRIGVDAIRMRCVARCSANPSPPSPPPPQRDVTIELGADRSGCGYSHLPCRWVDATFEGFASGRYLLECYWSTSRGSLGNRTASRTITVSSRSVDDLCWFNVQPGRYLTMVVDGVGSNTIQFASAAPTQTNQNNNDLPPSMADVDTGRATTPSPSQATVPSEPRNLWVRVTDPIEDDDRREDDFVVTWDPPISNGGAAISGYRIAISRPPISIGPDTRRQHWSTRGQASSPYRFSGLSCATYMVTVAAENRVGRGSISRSTISTECPQRRGYLNDDPAIRGGEASWLGQGTMAGWVQYKLGAFTANTYFPDEDNPNNPKAGDHIGTNGFHVVHIGDRKHYAYWTFHDVDPGTYNVQVYVPAHRDCTTTAGTVVGEVVEFFGGIVGSDYEAVCNFRFRPGANAEYRIYENVVVEDAGRTTFQNFQFRASLDQSSSSSDTGKWVTLGALDVTSSMIPTVRVGTFDLGQYGQKSYGHSTYATGDERWEHHLAVDAARLIPVDAVVDWSGDAKYIDAVSWCQSDVIYQLVIDPIVDLILDYTLGTIKATVIESAITGALVGVAAGLTAASGGIGTPLLVGTVGVKIASGAKFGVKVVTKVQEIWDLFRRLDGILDKIRLVRDTAEVFAEVLENFELSATGEDGLDHEFDLGSICEQDAVWENYYGDNNFGGEVQEFVRERVEKAARLVG